MMDQRDMVAMAVTTEPGRVRPRRLERRTYFVPHGRLSHKPSPGQIISTLHGVFWRVLEIEERTSELELILEKVDSHSPETHNGNVWPMHQGRLL